MRRLKNSIPALFIFLLIQSLLSAGNSLKNQDLIKQLYRDSDYLKKRAMISHTFEQVGS